MYSDDPEEPEIITDMISINTSASESSQQEHNDAGVLLLDQDGIQIIEKELSTNEYGVFQYILIKNETQSNIHAYVHHMRINGNEVGGTLDVGVITPEKRAKKALGFMNSDLNKAGIKTVQTIEASVRFVDDDTHTMLLEDIDIVIGEGTETKVTGCGYALNSCSEL